MNLPVARLVCAGLLFAPAAFAAEDAPGHLFAAPTAAAPVATSTAGGIGQMLFGLVLVLAAVFVVAFVAKRMRGFTGGGSNGIEVLGSTSLGAKERAVIVRVDGERLLLGVASGQVTLLKTLAPEATHEPPAVTQSQVQNFAALLRKSLGK
jgi:flagellar protein FliO/FliZ